MRVLGAVLGGLLVVPSLGLAQTATSISPAKAGQPVETGNGMAVTAQHLASDVGARILISGGNAIDAAVAIGYSRRNR